MATVSADELCSPFLSKMLGKLQVLSSNLKCSKQPNGKYLYEYSIQVHPDQEDEDLAGILSRGTSTNGISRSTSTYDSSDVLTSTGDGQTTASINPSYHSDISCIYMVTVRFVLFHRNMNGKAQSTTRAEFPSNFTLRKIIEYFRDETVSSHHGVFSPRLAYSVGRGYEQTHPLNNEDLDKQLMELMIGENEANTLSIIADIC